MKKKEIGVGLLSLMKERVNIFRIFLRMVEVDFLVLVLAVVIGMFPIFEFHVEIRHLDAKFAAKPLDNAACHFAIENPKDEERFRGVVHVLIAWILGDALGELAIVHCGERMEHVEKLLWQCHRLLQENREACVPAEGGR